MTRTMADASRDYRKRRADKLARYEAALRVIAAGMGADARIARDALNGRDAA